MENRDLFTVVCWPEVQFLMANEDFNANAVLIDNNKMYDEYGSSAYLVRISWLNQKYNKQ
jgi:hypothetical protein